MLCLKVTLYVVSEGDTVCFKPFRCGKLLKDSEAVQFHAAKTEHSSFSESVEEIKPLSATEKKEQLAK